MTSRPCRIRDCVKPAAPRRSVCHMHNNRIRRHGDPHHGDQTADDHDIDTVVRERRAVGGLTRLEQRRIARRLTAVGLPAAEIARIVCVAPRTVHRWRSEDRTAQVAA